MPAPTHFRRVIGGDFQDSLGNPLSLGYVTFQLNTDAVTGTQKQLDAGRVVTVPLDNTGNADGSESIWCNDFMLPVTTVYRIKAYSEKGQLSWQSENAILSGGATFDLGSLIPLTY